MQSLKILLNRLSEVEHNYTKKIVFETFNRCSLEVNHYLLKRKLN